MLGLLSRKASYSSADNTEPSNARLVSYRDQSLRPVRLRLNTRVTFCYPGAQAQHLFHIFALTSRSTSSREAEDAASRPTTDVTHSAMATCGPPTACDQPVYGGEAGGGGGDGGGAGGSGGRGGGGGGRGRCAATTRKVESCE